VPKHPPIISEQKVPSYRIDTTSGSEETDTLCKTNGNLDCDWERIIKMIILKKIKPIDNCEIDLDAPIW
jgi:hypothetical protein